MKIKYLLFFVCLLGVCRLPLHAQFSYLGTYNGQGKPNYLVSPDTLSNDFLAKIAASLPESKKVPVYNPGLISDGRVEALNLTCETDVWITFVDEGAGYRNVLGYYTYHTDSPLLAPSNSNIKIIFPNASKVGFGGDLRPGDKVYLGNFPAKTGIGLVLLADGWNGSAPTNGLWKLYSNSKLNPEKDTLLKKHTVLLNDPSNGRIVIGFEDIKRDLNNCDHDFNDLLLYFTLQSKQCVKNLDSIPDLTDDGKLVFSGNTGGVESKSLGDVLVKRVLQKAQNNLNGRFEYRNYPLVKHSQLLKQQQVLGNTTPAAKNVLGNLVDVSIDDFLKGSALDTLYNIYNTSPTDLTTFTNAQSVLSYDYTQQNVCRAVAFATKTNGDIYTHTKPICDRLRGAKLLGITDFYYNGLRFVRYTLQRAEGNIEYATSFSLSTATDKKGFTCQSNWLTADYTGDELMYNFQLWAAVPHLVTDLLIAIIDNAQAIAPVYAATTPRSNPTMYITDFKREGANLLLNINNLTASTNASIRLNDKVNELATLSNRSVSVALKPFGTTQIAIPMKDYYESDIRLQTTDADVQDLVYAGDGTWSVAYDKTTTQLNKFLVSNSVNRIAQDGELPVLRNVLVDAQTSNYVTVAKLLKGGGVAENLTTYKTLRLTASGGNQLRITLVKNSIKDWQNQYSVVLPLKSVPAEYLIALSEFTSKAFPQQAIDATDITSIVFNIENTNGSTINVVNTLSNIGFLKEEKAYLVGLQSRDIQLFPNPAKTHFNCSFMSDANTNVQIKVVELVTGKTIFSKNVTTQKGQNTIPVQLTTLGNSRLYVVSVEGQSVIYKRKNITIVE